MVLEPAERVVLEPVERVDLAPVEQEADHVLLLKVLKVVVVANLWQLEAVLAVLLSEELVEAL